MKGGAEVAVAASPEGTMRTDGCVTNFDHGAQRLTIWKSGDRYRLEEFGAGGKILPHTHDSVFQSVAAEVHRLASEIGKLRRGAIEVRDRVCTSDKAADTAFRESAHFRRELLRLLDQPAFEGTPLAAAVRHALASLCPE